MSKKDLVKNVAQASAGVVFMGDFNKDFTGLGKQTERRLDYAMELYRQGKFKYFVCTGGSRPKKDVFGADMMTRYLIARGIRRKDILIEWRSYDTQTNIKNTADMLLNHDLRSVLFISDLLHLKRIKRIKNVKFRDFIRVEYAPVNYDIEDFSISRWELYVQIHYEWISSLITYLPEKTYRNIVHNLRYQ